MPWRSIGSPSLLEEGAPVLEVYRRAEADVWGTAAQGLTRELRNYRALTERVMFMSSRMPMVLGRQVEYLSTRVTATPEIQRFVGTTEGLLTVLSGYPAALAKERQAAVAQLQEAVKGERQAALVQLQEQVKGERQAAIEQLAKAVAVEREAISRDVTARHSDVRQIVADVQRVIETTGGDHDRQHGDQQDHRADRGGRPSVDAAGLSAHRRRDHARLDRDRGRAAAVPPGKQALARPGKNRTHIVLALHLGPTSGHTPPRP
jgi:hypothetical protein